VCEYNTISERNLEPKKYALYSVKLGNHFLTTENKTAPEAMQTAFLLFGLM
jgi:hypothetical protein